MSSKFLTTAQVLDQTPASQSATPPEDGSPNSETYVIGVDIGGTNLRLALADAEGRILSRRASSTIEARNPESVVHAIDEAVEEMAGEASINRRAIRSIGAAVPGTTDVEAGVVIATSYLMGWRNVPFRHMLEEALNLPAAIDNDVNVAAVGESWVGSGIGVRDFVFLAIGTGIGAGLVLNGRPFRGAGWAAGEIGYMLVPGIDTEPAERGAPGPLEQRVGGQGIREAWSRAWTPQSTSLPCDITATEIFEGARSGDPLAGQILQQAAQMLSYAIYNMSVVLNCSLFVMGGRVGLHPVLCDATELALTKWTTRSPLRLVPSTLGEDAQLLGSIRLALDTADRVA